MALASLKLAHNNQPPRRGGIYPLLDALLLILFLGPVLSPLFRASGVPVVDETGTLARNMLVYICPTPAQSYLLFGFPMGVCARCWGATIGLWLARLWLPLALRQSGHMQAVPDGFRSLAWPVRLLLCALPFLLWPLEIVGTSSGWWALPPLWLLLVNGAQAGLAAGLFFLSVWPRFWPVSAAEARPNIH
jgi:hypothetical protein